jgi:uncharacterized protein YbdZ (MbtH family)
MDTTTSPVIYATFDAAQRRVQAIQRQYGVWTSVHSAPGGWRLGHDPDRPADDSKGETS